MTKPSHQNQGRDLVDAVVADYLRRVDAGELVDRSAFLREHPDVAGRLREFFEHYDIINEMVRSG